MYFIIFVRSKLLNFLNYIICINLYNLYKSLLLLSNQILLGSDMIEDKNFLLLSSNLCVIDHCYIKSF